MPHKRTPPWGVSEVGLICGFAVCHGGPFLTSLTCSGLVMFKKRYQDLFFVCFPKHHRKSKVTTVSCSIRINLSSMFT